MPLLKICFYCKYREVCGGINGDFEYMGGVPVMCLRFAVMNPEQGKNV